MARPANTGTGKFIEFTEATNVGNVENTDGVSKHRIAYRAYFLNIQTFTVAFPVPVHFEYAS